MEKDITTNKRDYGFDAIKAFLVILMIFGHTIDDFISLGVLKNDLIKALIYSFHMPAFVFVSGYFRKSRCKYHNVFINILAPYIIFTFLFCLIGRREILVDFFTPSYIYWYLLSMFFWCILADGIRQNVKYPILISVITALYAGCFDEVNRFMSASRTICFLPFFILGMKMREDEIDNIRNKKKWIFTIAFIVFCMITAFLNINELMPMHVYNAFCSYSEMGLSFLQGAGLRLLAMVVALCIIICLINIFDNKKSFLSNIGYNSITIFILSGFSVRVSYAILSHAFDVSKMSAGFVYAYALLVTVITIFIGNNKFIRKGYTTCISWIGNQIFKEE